MSAAVKAAVVTGRIVGQLGLRTAAIIGHSSGEALRVLLAPVVTRRIVCAAAATHVPSRIVGPLGLCAAAIIGHASAQALRALLASVVTRRVVGTAPTTATIVD